MKQFKTSLLLLFLFLPLSQLSAQIHTITSGVFQSTKPIVEIMGLSPGTDKYNRLVGKHNIILLNYNGIANKGIGVDRSWMLISRGNFQFDSANLTLNIVWFEKSEGRNSFRCVLNNEKNKVIRLISTVPGDNTVLEWLREY